MAIRKNFREIDEAEAKEREAARQYESLVGERSRLQRSIQQLEERVAACDAPMKALEQIALLAADSLPAGILTPSITRGLPGGYDARFVIGAMAIGSKGVVAAQRDRLSERLAADRKKLPGVERAIAELEQTHAAAS